MKVSVATYKHVFKSIYGMFVPMCILHLANKMHSILFLQKQQQIYSQNSSRQSVSSALLMCVCVDVWLCVLV